MAPGWVLIGYVKNGRHYLNPSQQVGQFSNIRRDPSRLIFGEQ
jgi:hypothetical protein